MGVNSGSRLRKLLLWLFCFELQQVAFNATASSIGTQFEGMNQTTTTRPADMQGAVGPAGIIQTVQLRISYYTKAGSVVWGPLSTTSFFTSAGTTSGFDTRTMYDAASGRFYVIMCERTASLGFLNIAVSKNSDPTTSGTNDWYFFRLDITEYDGVVATRYASDYPGLALDSQAFYVTFNQFGFFSGAAVGKFLHVNALAFDKAALNGGTLTYTKSFTPGTYNPATAGQNATNGFTLQPASVRGATSPGDVAYFAETPYYSTNTIRLWALAHPLSSTSLVSATLTVPGHGSTGNAKAPQSGTSTLVDTWSQYTQGLAFWHNGSVWFCNTAVDNAGRGMVHYYKVDCNNFPSSGSPTLSESGVIDPGAGEWTYQPAIGANDVGDICLVYTQSSASSFPTIMFAARAAGAGSFETPTVLKASPAFSNSDRWGDWASVAADPTDGTLWVCHEWAKTSTAHDWSTWFGQISQSTTIPANNTFASSTSISGASGSTNGYNFYCSKETSEPSHAGNAGGKSVWWQWTAPATGTAAIDTIGSSFDTLLGVYTGVSVNALTTTTSNNNSGGGQQSAVTFAAVSGTTYLVAVDGAGGAAGIITLNWSLNVHPTVSITSPANGTKFNAPANISITVNASDSDGTISLVEFDEGLNSLGTDASSPYSFAWNGVAAGNYSLTAVATDNLGATTTSSVISILVNALPTISALADKTITQDTSTSAIGFTVSDAETAASSLVVTGDSSNLGLVPNASIVLGGSGGSRTVTVTPAAGQAGSAILTLTVADADGGSANTSFTLTVLADSDHDGMPDTWEINYGFNPNNSSDAAIDSDGDGFSNLQEYLAGTNPLDPASALKITSTATSGSDATVRFTTVLGKTYRLERNDSFPAGAWTTVANSVAGTGSPVQVIDNGATSLLQRTYRVVIVP